MIDKRTITINFFNVKHSCRFNPFLFYPIWTQEGARNVSEVLIDSLYKNHNLCFNGVYYFRNASINFLAAGILFLANHGARCYDKNWNELNEVEKTDPETGDVKYSYFDKEGNPAELYRKKGRFADLPHVLSFLMEEYATIFDVLMTDDKVDSLIAPFKTALKNKAMDQLEGMIGILRIYLPSLVTPEFYWILSDENPNTTLEHLEKTKCVVLEQEYRNNITDVFYAVIKHCLEVGIDSHLNVRLSKSKKSRTGDIPIFDSSEDYMNRKQKLQANFQRITMEIRELCNDVFKDKW